MEPIEVSVRELVYRQFKKMDLKVTRFSNRAILENQCQSIIYSEWGIGNQYIWDLITEYVEEYIPEHLD